VDIRVPATLWLATRSNAYGIISRHTHTKAGYPNQMPTASLRWFDSPPNHFAIKNFDYKPPKAQKIKNIDF